MFCRNLGLLSIFVLLFVSLTRPSALLCSSIAQSARYFSFFAPFSRTQCSLQVLLSIASSFAGLLFAIRSNALFNILFDFTSQPRWSLLHGPLWSTGPCCTPGHAPHPATTLCFDLCFIVAVSAVAAPFCHTPPPSVFILGFALHHVRPRKLPLCCTSSLKSSYSSVDHLLGSCR